MTAQPSGPEAEPRADADPQEVARIICLNSLDRRPRTRAQLEDLLKRRNVPDEAASAVLDRFEEVGLVDDRRFAEQWVDYRQSVKTVSRSMLRIELQRKGVSRDVADDVLADWDSNSEQQQVRDLACRLVRQVKDSEPYRRRRKLADRLARRGFPPDVVWDAVNHALAGDSDER